MFLSFFVLCSFIDTLKSRYQASWDFNQGGKKSTAQLGSNWPSWVLNLPDHEHRIPINLFGFSLIFLNNNYFVYESYTYFATFIPRNLTDFSVVIFMLNSIF